MVEYSDLKNQKDLKNQNSNIFITPLLFGLTPTS